MRPSQCRSVVVAGRAFELGCNLRTVGLAALLAFAVPVIARADEGGVSFWLSGEYGSLAATPQVPGWAVGIINLYESENASGNVAAAREITIGRLNPTVNVNLNVALSAHADLVLISPTYVFATPVLGGQLAIGMAGAPGGSSADLNGTLTVSAGPLALVKQGQISDTRDGFSDLFPQTSLRWNSGVNSWMIYATGDIPVGTYDPSHLANLGLGHGAADGGVGYTYLDPKSGHELSVTTGLTYNFVNPSTGYQNGIDWHLDWGASQFVTKTVHLGAVGYFFQQLTDDSGCAPALCPFKSRTIGIGPQAGFIFPAGELQGYLNLKAYWDLDTQNRASGYTVWATLAFSPKPPETETPKTKMFTK
jgi:hypothetical protein